MAILDRRRRIDPRREQTEQAFLDAAASLLAEGVSFADLSVSRLAERAGRTRTAFYVHFEDRRTLLLRLVTDLEVEAVTAIEPFLRGDGRDDVRDAVVGLLEILRRHDVVVRVVVEAAGYDEQVAAVWATLLAGFRAAAHERLLRAGLDARAATGQAAVLVWMTERALTQQVTAAEADLALDDEALVDALADVWWRALTPAD